MERFFLNLKMERVWQRQYANHDEARRDISVHRRFLQRRTLALDFGLSVARGLRGETDNERTYGPVRNNLTTTDWEPSRGRLRYIDPPSVRTGRIAYNAACWTMRR